MFPLVTIKRGRTLWHARVQKKFGRHTQIDESEYLFTSPQISQALYHGIERLRSKLASLAYNNYGDYVVELTQLKVKRPFQVVSFGTHSNQVRYALETFQKRMKPFSYANVKLIQAMCDRSNLAGGYRAIWDQDQITLCPRLIRNLEVVRQFYYDIDSPVIRNVINRNLVTYNEGKNKPGSMYCRIPNYPKCIVKNLRSKLKSITLEKREAMKRLHSPTEVTKRRLVRTAQKIAKKFPSPSSVTFKRPTTTRKRPRTGS